MRRRGRDAVMLRCRGLACVIASLLLWSVCGERAVAQTGSLEAAVKATYLSKLAPFVQWPDLVSAPAATPIRICVFAAPGFAELVARATADQTANGHPFS